MSKLYIVVRFDFSYVGQVFYGLNDRVNSSSSTPNPSILNASTLSVQSIFSKPIPVIQNPIATNSKLVPNNTSFIQIFWQKLPLSLS
jgi:hypothetical protein